WCTPVHTSWSDVKVLTAIAKLIHVKEKSNRWIISGMKWRCTAKSLMSCRPCRSYDIHAEFRNRVHSNGTIGGQVQTAAGRIHFYANKYIMTKIWSNTDNKCMP
ncbi:hypothetical protein SeMB42_g08020, partial [Synchytrium endobioticum]